MRAHLFWGMASLVLAAAGCSGMKIAGQGPGWQGERALFDGTDLQGLEVKCKSADASKTFWKVDAGTILADSMGDKQHDYVWLATTREYRDFILRLRFQAYRASPGNSGVQVRSRWDEKTEYLDGPQVDINPPGPWRTGMIWDETRGSQRWLCPDVPRGEWVNEKLACPDLRFYYSDQAGGWNDMKISAIGTKIEVVLNGLTVTRYDGGAVLDDQVHNEHGVGREGIIALQIHKGDELKIRFKDIYLKDLSGRGRQG